MKTKLNEQTTISFSLNSASPASSSRHPLVRHRLLYRSSYLSGRLGALFPAVPSVRASHLRVRVRDSLHFAYKDAVTPRPLLCFSAHVWLHHRLFVAFSCFTLFLRCILASADGYFHRPPRLLCTRQGFLIVLVEYSYWVVGKQIITHGNSWACIT